MSKNRILRINELFDMEELKSENEIDILTGKFRDKIENMNISRKEHVGEFISKISKYHIRFLSAFIDYIKIGIKFNGFSVRIGEGEDGEFLLSTFDKKFEMSTHESDGSLVCLGIRINEVNNYDISIVLQTDGEASVYIKLPEDALIGYRYDKVSYNDVVDIIKDVYIPMLISHGFEDLVSYRSDDFGINN